MYGEILYHSCSGCATLRSRIMDNNSKNMIKLRSFHNRAIRYMTGQHIRKNEEEWSYPVHEELLAKCRLFPIETYIERRRGTLLEYLKKCCAGLLEEGKHEKTL